MKTHGNSEMDLIRPPKRIVMTFKDKQEDASYIHQMLFKANDKDYGDPVTPQDLIMMALRSLTDKHIELFARAAQGGGRPILPSIFLKK